MGNSSNPVTRRVLLVKAAIQAAANFERVCDAANARLASYFSLIARLPCKRRGFWAQGGAHTGRQAVE